MGDHWQAMVDIRQQRTPAQYHPSQRCHLGVPDSPKPVAHQRERKQRNAETALAVQTPLQ